jgi:hypothetical protein
VSVILVVQGLATALPLPDASVDAVVTDPPYGLEFMGREWDTFRTGDGFRRSRNKADAERDSAFGRASRTSPEYVAGTAFQDWCETWASECLRVLKPGGHLLAFGGTRTWHRLVCAIEDAGFEIRDSVADLTGYDAPGLIWGYGSGFPKSLNVAKAIASGGGRPEDIRRLAMGDDYEPSGRGRVNYDHGGGSVMNGATEPVDLPESAQAWAGWGTALKPGWEPIAVGRKPLIGTVAANVLEHGTGALNVNGCRVAVTDPEYSRNASGDRGHDQNRSRSMEFGMTAGSASDIGRWPPNVLLGEDAAAELDRQTGVLTSGANPARRGSDKLRNAYGEFAGQAECTPHRGADSGGASRFFPVFRYEAKAGAAERPRLPDGTAWPTVKPVALMQWLVRLVTPPGGTVLDLFAGTGTTGQACTVEGFNAILVDKDPQALALAAVRLARPVQPLMFAVADHRPAPAPPRPRPAPDEQGSLFDGLEAP